MWFSHAKGITQTEGVQSGALGTIYEHKRLCELSGGGRKVHSEELHNLYSSTVD